MSKRLIPVLVALGLAAANAQADGLKFLPILDAGFKAQPSVALSLGAMSSSAGKDNTVALYGIDFNMNCGLIQTPDNRIRTHLQINRANQSGVSMTSVELSPRYTVPLSGGFSFGAGPALAYVKADTGNGDKNLFGYGAVAGFNYRSNAYYAGLDLRYLNTDERNNVQLENWALLAKVGINF